MHSIFVLFSVLVSVNVIECKRMILRNDLTLNGDGPRAAGFANVEAAKVNEVQDILSQRWPRAEIPFLINGSDYDYLVSRKIRAAMDEIELVSCVKFVPQSVKPNDTQHWLHFTNMGKERECAHMTRNLPGGEIVVVLGYDCLQVHQILRSLMHGIGFVDEVRRANRFDEIGILWSNIDYKYRRLFTIVSSDDAIKEVPYDTRSIMHFHEYAFSKNGRHTVYPRHASAAIQPSTTLTHLDEQKLRFFFKKECQRRDMGILMDSCKDSLHAAHRHSVETTTYSPSHEGVTGTVGEEAEEAEEAQEAEEAEEAQEAEEAEEAQEAEEAEEAQEAEEAEEAVTYDLAGEEAVTLSHGDEGAVTYGYGDDGAVTYGHDDTAIIERKKF